MEHRDTRRVSIRRSRGGVRRQAIGLLGAALIGLVVLPGVRPDVPVTASSGPLAAPVGSPRAPRPVAAAPRASAPPTPLATVRAVLGAFNMADCARIYALTAPWKRPQPQDAGIAACQQGFADGVQNGVTVLRLSVGGPGHYLGRADRAYRQPVLLRRVLNGHAEVTRETVQLVRWRGHWYVLALW